MIGIIDVHTHTVASGHAYSTVMENIREASDKNLELLAITDHGSIPHETYFHNLGILPDKLFGVTIWKGIEANIIDYTGKMDTEDSLLEKLDIRIASLHTTFLAPRSVAENTHAICGAMDNPRIQIIGHPGDARFLLDMKKLVSYAKKTSTILEINNAQLNPNAIYRRGSYEYVKEMAVLCRDMNVPVLMGSDAHFAIDVGNFEFAIQLLEEIEMPNHLILNTSMTLFHNHIVAKETIYAEGTE